MRLEPRRVVRAYRRGGRFNFLIIATLPRSREDISRALISVWYRAYVYKPGHSPRARIKANGSPPRSARLTPPDSISTNILVAREYVHARGRERESVTPTRDERARFVADDEANGKGRRRQGKRVIYTERTAERQRVGERARGGCSRNATRGELIDYRARTHVQSFLRSGG